MAPTEHNPPNGTAGRTPAGAPLTAALPPPPLPASDRQWALLLDVDGTLLDFAPTPDAVAVPNGLLPLLERLQQHLHGALALVSGRAVADLDRHFAPLALAAIGVHGLERREAGGTVQSIDSIDALELGRIRSAVRRLMAALPGVLLEDKGCSFALHWRQAEPLAPILRRRLDEIAGDSGFEVLPGHYVYELKPAGMDKRQAVLALLEQPGWHGLLPIFIGDDRTDCEALAAVQEAGGIAIQVGALITSRARYGLADPTAVRTWLAHWDAQLAARSDVGTSS